MIKLTESAGDRTLYKFWIFKIPKIDGIDDNWNETLNGYLFYDSYFYNIYTRESNAKEVTHETIKESIPEQIKRCKESERAYGCTDCYMDYKGKKNPIRLWTVDGYHIISKSDMEYLKQLFHADYYK